MTEDEMLDGFTDSMYISLSKLWSWWWTGKPGLLQSMISWRVGHDWVTELYWTKILQMLGIRHIFFQTVYKVFLPWVLGKFPVRIFLPLICCQTRWNEVLTLNYSWIIRNLEISYLNSLPIPLFQTYSIALPPFPALSDVFNKVIYIYIYTHAHTICSCFFFIFVNSMNICKQFSSVTGVRILLPNLLLTTMFTFFTLQNKSSRI